MLPLRKLPLRMLITILLLKILTLTCSGMPNPATRPHTYIPIPSSCTSPAQCAAGYTCTPSGTCEIDLTHFPPPSRVFPLGTIILLALLAPLALALATCGVAALSAAVPEPWSAGAHTSNRSRFFRGACQRIRRSPNVDVAAVCGCCLWLAIALILGLSLGLTRVQTPVPPLLHREATPCGSLRDPACGPGLCNVRLGLCSSACDLDEQCAGGALCGSDKTCRIDTRARSVFGLWIPTFSIASLIAISLAAAAAAASCLYYTLLPMFSYHQTRALVLCKTSPALLLAAVIMATSIGLSFSTYKIHTPVVSPKPLNSTLPCASPQICFPYACAYDVGRCASSCTEHYQCASGYGCDAKTHTCVWNDGAGFSALWAATQPKWVSILLILGMGLVGIPLISAFTLFLAWFRRSPLQSPYQAHRRRRAPWCCNSVLSTMAIGFAIMAILTAVLLSSWLYVPIPRLTPAPHSPTTNSSSAATPLVDTAPASCAMVNARACDPYWCDMTSNTCQTSCAADYDCAAPSTHCSNGVCVSSSTSVKRKVALPWMIAVVAIAAGAAKGCCSASMSGLIVKTVPSLRDRSRLSSVVILIVLGASIIGAVVSLGVALMLANIWLTVPLAGIKPGSTPKTCTGVTSDTCWPYYCQTGNGTCANTCIYDHECRGLDPDVLKAVSFPTGMFVLPMCTASGSCILAPGELPTSPSLSVGILMAAGLGMFVLVALVLIFGVGPGSLSHPVLYGLRGSSCCIVVLVTTSLTLLLLALLGPPLFNDASIPSSFKTSSPSFANATAWGVACGPTPYDAVCEPFACDTRVAHCALSCTANTDCGFGYECHSESGSCVPHSTSTATWVWGTSLALGLCALLCYFSFSGCVKLFRYRVEAKANAEAALLAAYEAKAAAIPKSEVDIFPAWVQSPDTQSLLASSEKDEHTSYGTLNASSRPGLIQAVEVIKEEPDTPPPITRQGVCCICFAEEVDVSVVSTASYCSHGICSMCLSESLTFIVENGQFPGQCPGCVAEDSNDPRARIPAHVVEHLVYDGVVEEELGVRFVKLSLAGAFVSSELTFCPGCDLMYEVPDMSGKSARARERKARVVCESCDTAWCANCSRPWVFHRGLTCTKLASKQVDGEDAATLAIIRSTSKPCPACGTLLSRFRGHACHHVRCEHCRYSFCWVDLMPYPCGQAHATYCEPGSDCGCVPCPFCKPGLPCPQCPGDYRCPVCSSAPPPPSSSASDQGPLLEPEPEREFIRPLHDNLEDELQRILDQLEHQLGAINQVEGLAVNDAGPSGGAYTPLGLTELQQSSMETYMEVTGVADEEQAFQAVRAVSFNVERAIQRHFDL